MIHIVDPSRYDDYAPLLTQMYEMRARQFSTRREWRVEVHAGREYDMFDELGPVYVINADAFGRVRGSLRLLPTTGPHMLADVFSQIMAGEPVPRHPLMWESSRFNVEMIPEDGWTKHQVNCATNELLAGLFEAADLIGLKYIISVFDVPVARILKRAGCRFEPVGTRVDFDGVATVAGLFDVGPDVTGELRRRGGFETSVIDRISRESLIAA
jgi:acyl homoserine lactone synthase